MMGYRYILFTVKRSSDENNNWSKIIPINIMLTDIINIGLDKNREIYLHSASDQKCN